MYSNYNDELYVLMVVIGATILYFVNPLSSRSLWRRRKITLSGSSALLTYYTEGVTLIPVHKGVFGTLHYATFAGLSYPGDAGEASVIYQVILPYSSFAHLIGIPKKSGMTQLNPAGGDSIMEVVDLEGDYNDYFTLYAEIGMQEDSRYTLDPKAMVFTVDFCQSFSWEIVDNQLYIVQANNVKMDNPVDIAANIVQFVDEIRPAISRKLTNKEVEKVTPYSEEYRTDLKCPVCHSDLINEQDYLACPNGDGVLLKGMALTRLHAGALKIPRTLLRNQQQTRETIQCPGCGNPMEKVKYNGGKAIIDTCSHCPYRWLDASDQVF